MRISEFKNALKGGGARNNLFEVEVAFPAYAGGSDEIRQTAFLVKAAQIPASSLGVIEQPWRGRMLKLPGDRIYTEWTITVLNDTDFALRNAFERWSNAINGNESNVGFINPEEGFATASVFQLDREGNRVKEYTFKDVWPSEIAAIDLAHDSSNQVEEFPVTLQFSEWFSDTTS